MANDAMSDGQKIIDAMRRRQERNPRPKCQRCGAPSGLWYVEAFCGYYCNPCTALEALSRAMAHGTAVGVRAIDEMMQQIQDQVDNEC